MIPDLTWTQLAFLAIGLVAIVIALAIVFQIVIMVIASRRMRRIDREFDAMRGRRRF